MPICHRHEYTVNYKMSTTYTSLREINNLYILVGSRLDCRYFHVTLAPYVQSNLHNVAQEMLGKKIFVLHAQHDQYYTCGHTQLLTEDSCLFYERKLLVT